MSKLTFAIASLVASVVLPTTASAVVMFEIPDAGETLGTAQVVAGGTSSIQGSVSGDADLFKFTWGGGNFYVNSVGSTFDSQLFLFNASGVGVQGNDDGISLAGPAYLQLAGLAAGVYFLGISGFNYDPYSSGGLIFNSSPFTPLYGPNNLDPLTHWSGGSGAGNYVITFQQITSSGTPIGDPTPVGVPDGGSTIALLGLALSGLGFVRGKLIKA